MGYTSSLVSEPSQESLKDFSGNFDVPESISSSSPPDLKGSNGRDRKDTEPRIVLGLDYGTTYTGLAWMQTRDDGRPLSVADLRSFRNWPGKDAEKVPSSYSYSKTSRQARKKQWGYSIDDQSRVLRWTKLELEPRETKKELEELRELVQGLNLVKKLKENRDTGKVDEIPRHISKDAIEIIRDYLSKIARAWRDHMTYRSASVLTEVPLDIVITHPAAWKYEALNKLYQAVMGAFDPVTFPTIRHVYLVSEPEACALYTIQDSVAKGKNSLIVGDSFVLCDAGGGTVDLVSCRVDKVKPLKFTKVGVTSGGKFGATLIDKAFLEFVQGKVVNLDLIPRDFGSGGHFILGRIGRILLERFESVKHAFDGTNDGGIEFPEQADLSPTVPANVQGGEELLLKTGDLLDMFQKSIDGTVDLIQKQITLVREKDPDPAPYHIQSLILAGGFGQSPHLFNEVKGLADEENIEVKQADDCWGGVAKGAVLVGMGIGMDPPVEVRNCPRHYGLCLSETYANWKHESKDAVSHDYFDMKVVSNQLIWLVKKGALLLPGEGATSTYTVCCPFESEQETIRMIFVATNMPNPPSKLANLPGSSNQIIHYDIPAKSIPKHHWKTKTQWKNRRPYYEVILDCEFVVNNDVVVRFKCGRTTLKTSNVSL
ncbi:hypothetical protein B0J14DRAFT_605889 [Halenospora varia]|nr:hypothetical protein B0J14DRAFT_605889 [Halenospora varia]